MQAAQQLLERLYPQRRSLLKRQILLDALSCFIEYGLETTSIEMIREKSDSSVGAIYHHFKNKDGIVAVLVFAALDDQAQLRDQYLQQAKSLKELLYALIYSYVDWVSDQPKFAQFLLLAHFSVQQGEFRQQLHDKNKLRNQKIVSYISNYADASLLKSVPAELMMSLVIGATESYCRAWLSEKVMTNPRAYRETLAQAAWDSLQHLSKN
ncbi:TetR/AcrR family transcriptional regulator [Acinetobacter sp. C26M]|uniref:TetR/AcrR family transcriptional regulator n=1 Tax=unclassified Acinetobacter TaxID=196816 RepID=UPI002036EF6B|nr:MULTISPECIES: TetR/AcrR family transcriptional regulator [unclassified Acinetobacter]USA45650.1 TetR/AcrR family transcriptional regulator [Acinetobacter sp. C26M]USA49149.1 TetR/AcrR family transcriptional regulator [Acinetobacter sp. C26G]